MNLFWNKLNIRYKNLTFLLVVIYLQNNILCAQNLNLIQSDSTSNLSNVKKGIQIPKFNLIDSDTISLEENDLLVCDSYSAYGQPYVYDALHSFNSRRSDKFGGYLNVKINAALAEIRQQGFYSDLKKLYIQIDPTTLTVYWIAVVGPSNDGKCYVSVDSRGSAGGGIPAVNKQLNRMHHNHGLEKPAPLLEFNENVIQCFTWNGAPLDSVCQYINIRQHFYKYYDPRIGTEISLENYNKIENQKDTVSFYPTATVVAKTKPTKVSVKTYKVKSGDTLSQIAEKFHTTPARIRKLNQISNDLIRVGQVIKL